MVFVFTQYWDVNWAVALENALDAHPPYLHRNAVTALMNPLPLHGPRARPLATLPSAVGLARMLRRRADGRRRGPLDSATIRYPGAVRPGAASARSDSGCDCSRHR